MKKAFEIDHDYAAPAERLWEIVSDLDSIQDASGNMLVYYGLPGGQMYKGQSLHARVSVFGVFPPFEWHVDVINLDSQKMFFHTREQGAGMVKLETAVIIQKAGSMARLREIVRVEAGWLTPMLQPIMRLYYRRRHKPRLRLLGLME